MKRTIIKTKKCIDYAIKMGPLYFSNDGESFFLDQEIKEFLSQPIQREKSNTEEKIEKIKGNKFISSLVKPISNDKNSIIPNISQLSGGIPEKQMTLLMPPETSLFLFEIYFRYDYISREKRVETEILDWIDSEDKSTRTFFWDNPAEDKLLALFSFKKTKNKTIEVYVSSGIYENGLIKMSLTPTIFTMQEKYAEYIFNNTSTYIVSNTQGKELEEQIIETEIDQLPVIIFDPVDEKLVLREVYYDEQSSQKKARVCIKPSRGYLVFEVLFYFVDDIDKKSYRRYPLNDFELGYLHKSGLEGFPQDSLLAVRHFEADGTPESLYQIAGIFATDEAVSDDDMYLHFLSEAASKGSPEAIAELAYVKCVQNSFNQDEAIECFGNSLTTGVGSFLCACYLEMHLKENINRRKLYDLYYQSATTGFAPAQARLQCEYNDLSCQEEIYTIFLNNNVDGLGEYCLGCMRFGGYSCYEQKSKGIDLLTIAADKGLFVALEALYEIYKDDYEKKDDFKATSILMRMVDQGAGPIELNILANRLLDGVGCKKSTENDAKAFEILQKASLSEYSTAQNNLGWMYKTGRGCKQNFEKALEYFHKAKSATAYFHIGEMYENGWGVPMSEDLAKQYYTTAAEKGSEKAIKRLSELRDGIIADPTSKGYAFISYSTKNQAAADAIRELFKKHNIDTWMAPYNIPAGSKYASVITKAIRDCSCFVLLLSNDSQVSEAVDSEVELATLTFKKSIIVVEIEKVVLNDSFMFYVHNKQIIAVHKIDDAAPETKQVLDAVSAYIKNGRPPKKDD